MSDIRANARRILSELSNNPQLMRLLDLLAERICTDPACVDRDCVVERMKREER